jgi:GNAT superfamily N-acetyltransferase
MRVRVALPISDWLISGRQLRGTFEIRRAVQTDAKAILECLVAAFSEYRDQYTAEAFADTVMNAESLQRRMGEMSLFVACCDGEIVGTIGCSVNGEEGHLRGMAVLPSWQRRGVALALLQAAEAELAKGNCTRATLDTTEPLTRAIRFYETHGFAASGRVTDFFGMRLYEYTKALL